MLTIDGSQGEGGGQILRSSLALAIVTGTPFQIEKIRAGREKPGLMRQHLTAVEAAARIGDAMVEGAGVGSRELTFVPRGIVAGEHHFAVGTAGSGTLVLQTILPPLLTASRRSHLVIEGGTHNPFAPPFDFLEKAFLPLVSRMGPQIAARLERAGFYPAGGGAFTVEVSPAARLERLDLIERGEIVHRAARARVSRLPISIAQRELAVVSGRLGWAPELLHAEEIEARGPGNILTIEVGSAGVTEVFTGFGERGRRAEAVADQAVSDAERYLAAGVPVGECLADQLLLPMALAGAGSFVTLAPSRHTHTNADVIRQFLGIEARFEQLNAMAWRVSVG